MTARGMGLTDEQDRGIDENNVRAVVRLLGEVAALRGDHAAKKRLLLSGLVALIDAHAWAWALMMQPTPYEVPICVNFLHGGFGQEQFAAYLQAIDHPDLARFTAPFLLEVHRRQRHTTRMRQQSDPENRFAECDAYPLWCKAGIVPGIMSSRPLTPDSHSLIGLYRAPGRPPFSERELRLAHIVLSEVPWLHDQGWPGDRGVTVPRLALRLRQVLNLLIEGLGRKEIAASLDLSLHTANGYVKDVYRHFQVRSHAELMRRFLCGDGGDQP